MAISGRHNACVSYIENTATLQHTLPTMPVNVIIPMGGTGERMKPLYTVPKPWIQILGKPMICHVLDHLVLEPDDQVFIIYCTTSWDPESLYDFKIKMRKWYPHVSFIPLDSPTQGAAETVLRGMHAVANLHLYRNLNTMVMDCDAFYTEDVVSMYKKSVHKDAVFYTKNTDPAPLFSYIQMGGTGPHSHRIRDIREKEKISDFANTGIYCFSTLESLLSAASYIIQHRQMFHNEFYISRVVSALIHQERSPMDFHGIELVRVFSLGTMDQIKSYQENTCIFLCDLDGTLVLTDDVYFDVWRTLLQPYGMDLTESMFGDYIAGKCDSNVVQTLIPHAVEQVDRISQEKDRLFLEHLDSRRSMIREVAGATLFLQTAYEYGHKMALVTNSNRRVAKAVVQYFKWDRWVDVLVTADQCERPKPFPDPYLKAMAHFRGPSSPVVHLSKTIIFEDSKTGFMSAKSASPDCIVGIETTYRSQEIMNHGAQISFPNFLEVDLEKIHQIMVETDNKALLKRQIASSLCQYSVVDVDIDDKKMKGGFIADVISLRVLTQDSILHGVLKMENRDVTMGSTMAKQLQLYEREYYFYAQLAHFVPVAVPKYLGMIKNSEYQTIGVLLENMHQERGQFNVDLNRADLEVSFTILRSMAKVHATFWNKDLPKSFSGIKMNNDGIFQPFLGEFLVSKFETFKYQWQNYFLETHQMAKLDHLDKVVQNYGDLQDRMSSGDLTLCHGDIKSANIYYKMGYRYDDDDNCSGDLASLQARDGSVHSGMVNHNNNALKSRQEYEPVFLDWQHMVYGKGAQDLVFFMIESFHTSTIQQYATLFAEYYYIHLTKYGVKGYAKDTFLNDCLDALDFVPVFVMMWFGTMDSDELIDKDFPFEFIRKWAQFPRNVFSGLKPSLRAKYI